MVGRGPATVAGERGAHAKAERRQLTVMFCDLVGSTALAEKLDPEELRDVLRAYQETSAAAVERFDGHIAKYIGDGLLVYFGYPQAHEDDARRAVSAGLGIVEGVGGLNQRLAEDHGIELGVRVGIHTGLVVAGEMGGGETREADAIVGETPNVAARLEGLAEPNTVVISAATQTLVEGLFESDDLGRTRLKGIAEPIQVYGVRGESAAPSRFEAAAERGLTPLVGREEEIGLLLKRWNQAREGEGQVVLLSGEAGVGKSRVVRAFRERLEGDAEGRVLYYYGSAYHQDSALYPVIEQIRREMNFARADTSDAKLDKLERKIESLGLPAPEIAPHLASLLSLPVDGRYPPLHLGRLQLKAKTLESVIALLEAMAAQSALLLVVEDAHWIDPSTLDLLDLAIERLRSIPMFLLVSYRPEFVPPWSGEALISILTLGRFGGRDSRAIVVGITGDKALPEEVVLEILSKTDGVPLFVEELTKTVIESDLITDLGDRYDLTRPLSPLAIPASLQDSLMARLDRLALVKEVAQLAAVLGRTFSHEVLAAVSPLAEDELDRALAELVKAEVIYRRGLAPDVSYEFKHALLQDAAYQSLLKSTRHQHHDRIAQTLEERFRETMETQPELLAHHFTEAGQAHKAVDYWLRAGRHAASRSADMETIRHLKKGLSLLDDLPAGASRDQQELSYLITLGPALMATQGWGSREVDRTYSRARFLAQKSHQPTVVFPAIWGVWLVAHAGGQAASARELLKELIQLAHQANDETLILQAHHAGGSTMCSDGVLHEAQKHIDAGIALYKGEQHADQAHRYGGHDPCVCAYSLGALNQFMLGYLGTAEQFSLRALDLAPMVAHRPSVAHAHWYRAELSFIKGEPAEAARHAHTVLEIAEPYGLDQYATWANMLIGWSRVVQGESRDGLDQVERNLAKLRKLGIIYHFPHRLVVWTESLAAAGKIDKALRAVDEALTWVQESGEHWYEAETLRLKARVVLADGSPSTDQAEDLLLKAIAISGEQGARLWTLRAATSLARLWQKQEKRKEARNLLAPAYGWFSEGFDTSDLKGAKALLDTLA